MWDKLIKEWSGKVYQTKNKRVRERFNYFKRIASDLKDRDILEFGCNAGLFCLPLAKYAKSYTGIEKAEKYYKDEQQVKVLDGLIEELEQERDHYKNLKITK